MLEFADNFATDRYLLTGIPKEIADQPDRLRLLEFNKHHQIGNRGFQSWMNRVPDAFPAIDVAFRPYLFPCEIEAMTGMADPFRTPLPDSAAGASLDQQPPGLGPIPKGRAETVPRGHGDGQH